MIRTALTAALFSLTTACGGQAQVSPPLTQHDISVQATPVVLFPDDPGRMRIGDLRFTGGLVLESKHERFGGWSALRLRNSGEVLDLTLLSDRGALAYGQVGLDALNQPVSMSLGRMETLVDLAGAPLAGDAADAEALAGYSDGRLAVSFERDHRIWT